MLWLKRNILLVISALGALALLGIAIVYLLSEYAVYNSYDESIKQLKDGIKTLSEYNPTPSEANIAIIKNNGVVLKKFMGEAEGLFVTITNQPIAPGPFMILLDKNIAELTREATNSGITLPPRYKFTFGELLGRQIQVALIPDLIIQLEEIRAIASVLFESRISSLQSIQRTPVKGEPTSSNPEFLTDRHVVTNHYGIVAPYVVSFKCFTPELGSVLNRFATNRYFLVVRKIDIQSSEGGPAPAPKADPAEAGGGTMPMPNPNPAMAAPRQPAPGVQPPGKAAKGAGAPKSNLVKILDEKPLLVTMKVDIIKPYKGPPRQVSVASPPAAGAAMTGGNGEPPQPPPGTPPAKSKKSKATMPPDDSP